MRIGQDATGLVRELELRVTGDLRQLCELLPQGVGHGAGLDADAVEYGRHDAVGLLGEDEEQVGDLELAVALRFGELLCADDRLGARWVNRSVRIGLAQLLPRIGLREWRTRIGSSCWRRLVVELGQHHAGRHDQVSLLSGPSLRAGHVP